MTDDLQEQLIQALSKAIGEAPKRHDAAAPTPEGMAKIIREYQAGVVRQQNQVILDFLESIPVKQWGWVRVIYCVDPSADYWTGAPPHPFIPELVNPRGLRERWQSRKQRQAIAAHVAELRAA